MFINLTLLTVENIVEKIILKIFGNPLSKVLLISHLACSVISYEIVGIKIAELNLSGGRNEWKEG